MHIIDEFNKIILIQTNYIEYLDNFIVKLNSLFQKHKNKKYEDKQKTYDAVFDNIERLKQEGIESKNIINEKMPIIQENTDKIKDRIKNIQKLLDDESVEINSTVKTIPLQDQLKYMLSSSTDDTELPTHARTILRSEYGGVGNRRKSRKTIKRKKRI